MDLGRARVFVHVAESGSLSRAATLLDMQPSVVSRAVSAFERDLGGRLFHRTGRGVTPTELGERILPRIRSLLQQADQLADEIQSTAGVPVGEVRVGVLPSMSHPLVSILYRTLREHFPAIRLRIDEGSGGQLAEWVASGHVDMAILFRGSGAGKDHAIALRRVAMHLVGPAGDALTRAASVPFTRLDGLPLVLPGARSGLRTMLEQLAQRKRIALNVAMEADSVAVQKDVVAENGAHTILALQAVHREIRQGRLQAARITGPAIERTIALSTTVQHPLTLAGREVARLIRLTMEKMPTPPDGGA
jgi:LysR family nitrogen assimilation transcriptional regulator